MAVIKNGTPFNTNVTAPTTGVQMRTANVNTHTQTQATNNSNTLSGPKNQNPSPISQLKGQAIKNKATKTIMNMVDDTLNGKNKYQIEETIGGNNYYYPNGQGTTQGQENALNGTGHVAGIPNNQLGGLNYSQTSGTNTETPTQQQPEQTTTTTGGTPKSTKGGTKGTGISNTNNTENTEREPYADIVNGGVVTQGTPEEQQEQPVDNTNEQALANMEADLQMQGGKIYGKVSENNGDATAGINTMVDPYSVEATVNQARISNLKNLQTMDSQDIATSIASGTTPYGDQALRDLMQYNPTKYNEVQQYLKQQQGQEAVDSIMSTGNISATSQTQTATDNVNNDITNWSASVSKNPEESEQVTTNIMNTMANNQVATTATQEMLNLNAQLADYEYKLEHVRDEATRSFKGDVPQYLIDAKANNLTQKYQAEISKLQSRYNSALDLYKTELAQAQWQEEMKLKYLQFQETKTNNAWSRYYQSQSLLQNSVKRVDGIAYQVDPSTGTYKQLTNQTAYNQYTQAVNTALQGYTSMFYEGYEAGMQCETFTDNFTEATTGIRMTGENGRGWTTAEEKLSYVNDFTPQVGSVVVAVGGAYNSQYGHTMLITGYDPSTGIMDLLWSNKNGDKTIHKSRTTMADIQRNSTACGIWNPYKTAQEQSIMQSGLLGTTQYGVTVTPMTAMFDSMIQSGKNQDTVAKAEQSYTYLYEMVNDGSLQQLIDSGDFGKIMAYMSKGNFGEKDDEGAKFANRLKTYIEKKAAKELTGGDQSLKALNKLMQLVEVKLRKESGAAINSSERLTNFEMFLPSPGESAEYQREKMRSRDSLILRNLRSAGLPSVSLYVPIFGTQARQIRSN